MRLWPARAAHRSRAPCRAGTVGRLDSPLRAACALAGWRSEPLHAPAAGCLPADAPRLAPARLADSPAAACSPPPDSPSRLRDRYESATTVPRDTSLQTAKNPRTATPTEREPPRLPRIVTKKGKPRRACPRKET